MSTEADVYRRPEQQWTVLDFKSIEHACLGLTSLSILTGANSAGKSSLLQSLLLLGQSAQEEQIVLNGSLVSLGEAQDIVRRGQKDLTLGYSVPVPRFLAQGGGKQAMAAIDLHLGVINGELELVGLELVVDERPLIEANRTAVATNAYKTIDRRGRSSFLGGGIASPSVLQVHFLESNRRMPVTLLEVNGVVPEAIFSRRRVRQRRDELTDLITEAPSRFATMRQLMSLASRAASEQDSPQSVADLVAALRADSRMRPGAGGERLEELAISDEAFNFIAEGPWLEWEAEFLGRRGMARQAPESVSSRDEVAAEAIHYLGFAAAALTELGASITYLGPLRDEPRVVSPMGRGSRSLPVGSRGEYTADFLVRRRSRPISYCSPSGEMKHRSLIEAVSEWIEFLGIGSRISVSNRGKLGLTLRLELDGVERDLTTVGVGASQLLPVVVVLLGAEPGAVVLLEQPELHLHPAVQSRLGEFLVTARPDLRIVVETHSENLLTRIRLRVVEGRVDADSLCILFGEQESGVTTFRQLSLNRFGDLNEWPIGFFDAGETDSSRIVSELARNGRLLGGDAPS